MDFFLFLSLLVFVLAVTGATIVVVRRGITLYYDVRRLTGAVGSRAGAIARSAASAPEHLEAAAASAERLAASTERLRVSLARASILRDALQDAIVPVRRVRRAARK